MHYVPPNLADISFCKMGDRGHPQQLQRLTGCHGQVDLAFVECCQTTLLTCYLLTYSSCVTDYLNEAQRTNVGLPSFLKSDPIFRPPSSSSSCMRVINRNWSATKQHPHPQSVAEISRHSVLSGDRIRQCETSSGSRHKDTDQCL